MYLIISNNLKTNELFARAQFSGRLEARKNLLKEAQSWLCTFKPGNLWEIITHKKDNVKFPTVPYFVKHSNKNEDLLILYERVDIVEKGWLYNNTTSKINKILMFSVVEVAEKTPIEKSRLLIIEPPKEKTEIILKQKNLFAELKTALDQRRINVE